MQTTHGRVGVSDAGRVFGLSSIRSGSLALILVVVVLLGSVLVPARETWRIMDLLRETTNVIEPARVVGARLEFGLTTEAAALERYALSGDSAQLARYRTTAAEDDSHLATMTTLAQKLDADAIARAAAVRSRVDEWRAIGRGLADERLDRAQLSARLTAQRAVNEQALRNVARLSAYLAAEGNARRELIKRSERLGLFVNASLVLIALAAVIAVSGLRYRERRLTRILERRVDEELSLRQVARALGAATTPEGVLGHIAEGAIATTQASGAYAEYLPLAVPDDGDVIFVRHDRGSPPSPPMHRPRVGSLSEAMLGRGAPGSLTEVDSVSEWMTPGATESREAHAGLIAPLRSPDRTFGVLVLLRTGASAQFDEDSRRQIRILADLAAAALQRLAVQAAERLALDEARDGRAELQRIMKSRSRLMRGFSHDVKNPLGAADGYAELLTTGIYGALSPEQTERVECIRRSLRVAVALIDDLHQLARAEVGRLELSVTPVDLGELARASGEEYGASARASGLSLSVDVPPESIIIATDRARVRQIVGNLLSNAIKYTACGSIVLRVRRWPLHPLTQDSAWAAIEVTDSGVGIPPDRWDTIFEEFVRLGTGEKSGAGLGLAISQRLAQALGGQITVESEVGSGSTFTLWLPTEKALSGPGPPTSRTGAPNVIPPKTAACSSPVIPEAGVSSHTTTVEQHSL